MKIGLVGAGQIGGALARRLTALGHQVLISNSRGPETLADLAAETGATAVERSDAVRDVDLIVLTIRSRTFPPTCSPAYRTRSRSSTPTTTIPDRGTARSRTSNPGSRKAGGWNNGSAIR
jgi:predicted dinucleotide-binding enzyme